MTSRSISKLSKIKQKNFIKKGVNKKNIDRYSKILSTIIQRSTIILTCLKSLNLDLFALKFVSIIFIALCILEAILKFLKS